MGIERLLEDVLYGDHFAVIDHSALKECCLMEGFYRRWVRRLPL
jgi:hypothetical protein